MAICSFIGFAVLTVLAASTAATVVTTCAECTTTYTTSVNTVPNEEKCGVARNYINCLLAAPVDSSGCDTFTARAGVATTAMTNLNSLSTITCVNPEACLCEISYRNAAKVSDAQKCVAALELTRCTENANTAPCLSSKTATQAKTGAWNILKGVKCYQGNGASTTTWSLTTALILVTGILFILP